MLKARYYQADGKEGGARGLPESLFDGVVNEAVLHQVVKAYLANQRQGTQAGKNRSAVAGGSRKPWRQKGTGRARQGTIRAAQWVGGGRAFPPIPHSWRERVPKKVRAVARRSAFSARAGDDRVLLVDALDFEAPKTRRLVSYLDDIGAEGKVLILTDGIKPNVVLSARNEARLQVLPFGEESPYHVLWATTVVIEASALETKELSAADAKKVDGEVTVIPSRRRPVSKARIRAKTKPAPKADAGADEKPESKVPAKKKAAAKAPARKAAPKKTAAKEAAPEKKADAPKKESEAKKAAPKKEAASEKKATPKKTAAKKATTKKATTKKATTKKATTKKAATKKAEGGKSTAKKAAPKKKADDDAGEVKDA
jgi:large subunit ribosomal protein L4